MFKMGGRAAGSQRHQGLCYSLSYFNCFWQDPAFGPVPRFISILILGRLDPFFTVDGFNSPWVLFRKVWLFVAILAWLFRFEVFRFLVYLPSSKAMWN